MGTFRRSSRFFIFTRRDCCVKSCTPLLRICDTFDHCGHASRTSLTSFRIQVTISNHASTSDSHHGIAPTTLEQQIRMFFAENIHAAANFYNYYGDIMPSLSLRLTTGSDPAPTGFSVPFRLRLNFHFPRFGFRRASGNACYVHI